MVLARPGKCTQKVLSVVCVHPVLTFKLVMVLSNLLWCQVAEFTRAIRRYIESCDVGNGGDFWPIVKHVSIRVPHCNVCSSGAVLVDLPGIGDSNPARDEIAKNVSMEILSLLFFLQNIVVLYYTEYVCYF